jgi:hypothetical protein
MTSSGEPDCALSLAFAASSLRKTIQVALASPVAVSEASEAIGGRIDPAGCRSLDPVSRAGLGAAPIRVNRVVANGHSSRAPGEAIVVCAVESIRGRYLSVLLPVLGCVSPSARRALILFDLVASYKS